jgi:hypothetical protein
MICVPFQLGGSHAFDRIVAGISGMWSLHPHVNSNCQGRVDSARKDICWPQGRGAWAKAKHFHSRARIRLSTTVREDVAHSVVAFRAFAEGATERMVASGVHPLCPTVAADAIGW